MDQPPDKENGGQRTPPRTYACNHCGGTVIGLSVLDSRKDKSYQLLRCITCGKMDWYEE